MVCSASFPQHRFEMPEFVGNETLAYLKPKPKPSRSHPATQDAEDGAEFHTRQPGKGEDCGLRRDETASRAKSLRKMVPQCFELPIFLLVGCEQIRKTQDEPQWIVAQRLLSALTVPGFK